MKITRGNTLVILSSLGVVLSHTQSHIRKRDVAQSHIRKRDIMANPCHGVEFKPDIIEKANTYGDERPYYGELHDQKVEFEQVRLLVTNDTLNDLGKENAANFYYYYDDVSAENSENGLMSFTEDNMATSSSTNSFDHAKEHRSITTVAGVLVGVLVTVFLLTWIGFTSIQSNSIGFPLGKKDGTGDKLETDSVTSTTNNPSDESSANESDLTHEKSVSEFDDITTEMDDSGMDCRTDVNPILTPQWIAPHWVQKVTLSICNDSNRPNQISQDDIYAPLVPKSTWANLTGREFLYPYNIKALAKTGITVAVEADYGLGKTMIEWKPEPRTKRLLDDQRKHPNRSILPNAIRLDDDNGVKKEGHILVWTGQWKTQQSDLAPSITYHGSEQPLIKTQCVVGMSPRDLANLLMDSNRVQEYNKMSLGRTDEVILQQGIDASDEKMHGILGEAKIVRNVTKPPLAKKSIEFFTLMYARRLSKEDRIGPSIVGAGSSISNNTSSISSSPLGSIRQLFGTAILKNLSVNNTDPLGYIVVSRAVSGHLWANNICDSSGETCDDLSSNGKGEILLGVNLLREVPGNPQQTEVTTVTHVYSPSVPKILASTIGVKGAIDFIKSLRSLCEN